MGTLFVVATPIGNLSDVSKRMLEILSSVDFIAAEDTRQTIKLLNHYDIKKKLVAYHKFNEKTKSNQIMEALQSGKNVALVSDAGTPCISDPGYVLVKEARRMKIPVIGIPGPCALVTALSISGQNPSQFCFIGFLPTDHKKFQEEIEKIRTSSFSTFVIYESPKRLVKLVEKLSKCFPDSQLFIASDLTKVHERGFFGTIEAVYEQIKRDPNIEKGEYVVILEKPVVELSFEQEELSLEAYLLDTMVQNQCSLKEAVFLFSKKTKKWKKNEIYEASLRLKNMF